MRTWAQIRRAGRVRVHQQFAIPGEYYAAANVGPGLPVTVRTKSKVLPLGELQHEGFARSLDDTLIAIFLTADVEKYQIKKGGIVKLEDMRVLRLVVRNAVLDNFTSEFQSVLI